MACSIYKMSVFSLQAPAETLTKSLLLVQVQSMQILPVGFLLTMRRSAVKFSTRHAHFVHLPGEPAPRWNGWQGGKEDCQQCPAMLLGAPVLQGSFAVWVGLCRSPSTPPQGETRDDLAVLHWGCVGANVLPAQLAASEILTSVSLLFLRSCLMSLQSYCSSAVWGNHFWCGWRDICVESFSGINNPIRNPFWTKWFIIPWLNL